MIELDGSARKKPTTYDRLMRHIEWHFTEYVTVYVVAAVILGAFLLGLSIGQAQSQTVRLSTQAAVQAIDARMVTIDTEMKELRGLRSGYILSGADSVSVPAYLVKP